MTGCGVTAWMPGDFGSKSSWKAMVILCRPGCLGVITLCASRRRGDRAICTGAALLALDLILEGRAEGRRRAAETGQNAG